jgi:hypothetical protein
MHVCAAVDGTAKKMYSDNQSERRTKRFIVEHVDIIQHMLGGIDIENTIFPLKDKKGVLGIKFEDVLYSHYRCKLMHGDDLGDGWGVEMSVAMHYDQFSADLINKTMTLPQSAIYALGLPCVLSEVNQDQIIGQPDYFYKDMHYTFFIDSWWGKIDVARSIIYFDRDIKVNLDFQHHM